MWSILYNFFKMKNNKTDYRKENIRGTIKEIMRTRGLRSISMANYFKWLGQKNITGVHSLKLNLEDGYLYMYGFKENPNDIRAGERLNDISIETYENVFNAVSELMKIESEIPCKIRKNITVKVNR